MYHFPAQFREWSGRAIELGNFKVGPINLDRSRAYRACSRVDGFVRTFFLAYHFLIFLQLSGRLS